MKRNLSGSLLVVLMFILQSWALSLQAPDEVLTDAPEAMEVIPATSALNAPGFHQGSIFSEATLAAGGHHTCAILDNMSISCWGDDSEGQLGTDWNHPSNMFLIPFYGASTNQLDLLR